MRLGGLCVLVLVVSTGTGCPASRSRGGHVEARVDSGRSEHPEAPARPDAGAADSGRADGSSVDPGDVGPSGAGEPRQLTLAAFLKTVDVDREQGLLVLEDRGGGKVVARARCGDRAVAIELEILGDRLGKAPIACNEPGTRCRIDGPDRSPPIPYPELLLERPGQLSAVVTAETAEAAPPLVDLAAWAERSRRVCAFDRALRRPSELAVPRLGVFEHRFIAPEEPVPAHNAEKHICGAGAEPMGRAIVGRVSKFSPGWDYCEPASLSCSAYGGADDLITAYGRAGAAKGSFELRAVAVTVLSGLMDDAGNATQDRDLRSFLLRVEKGRGSPSSRWPIIVPEKLRKGASDCPR